jgi:iron complex transport system permease protein
MQNKAVHQLAATPSTRTLVALGAFLLLALGLLASLLLGERPIAPSTVFDALFHYEAASTTHTIVRDWRLPRALADVLVGASLAVAGAIMQAITRNPLASPGIMGLNSGASFAAIVAIIFLPDSTRSQLMLLSILGAAFGAALVYGLGSLSRGGLTPVRLALTGMAVSALLGAMSNGLTIYYQLGQDLMLWFARGTEGVGWRDVAMISPLICIGLITAVSLAPSLGVLSLGDQVARGLGQRTRATKFIAAVAVLVLAGSAVSLAGPVGFVGLVVPHLVRYLVGLNQRVVIPVSAVFGSILMLYADLLARLSTTPFKTPVPVGVVTALLGVPFFLYLACRRHSNSREGCV